MPSMSMSSIWTFGLPWRRPYLPPTLRSTKPPPRNGRLRNCGSMWRRSASPPSTSSWTWPSPSMMKKPFFTVSSGAAAGQHGSRPFDAVQPERGSGQVVNQDAARLTKTLAGQVGDLQQELHRQTRSLVRHAGEALPREHKEHGGLLGDHGRRARLTIHERHLS